MPTYENCYEILNNLRYAINENSDGLVKGTDTTGAFQNSYLIGRINKAQYYLWGILFQQIPELFMKSAAITFTSSVATLPSDFFKMKEISDSEGYPINPINVGDRHIDSNYGSSHQYYRYGNTLKIDRDSVTDTGTIWYYQRPRELTAGMTSAGGALSATLASTAKGIADYYNGMMIENVTDNTSDTITDYTAARVCTVSNTWAASKYYGIISEMPEIFHALITERAIIQVKQHPKAPFKVTAEDISIFADNLRSALCSYAGSQNGDVSIGSIINDFDPIF
ncbi:MAG: hypothetical protein WC455_16420 [Dehalococcoidia bacterium]|jgi:hypothetical protein